MKKGKEPQYLCVWEREKGENLHMQYVYVNERKIILFHYICFAG